jgi:hypothetical protein
MMQIMARTIKSSARSGEATLDEAYSPPRK